MTVVTEELRDTHPDRLITDAEITSSALQARIRENTYNIAQRILGEYLQRHG